MIFIFSWVVLTSSIGFFLMGWDKSRSRERGSQRIPEGILLFLATIGGAAGVLAGMFFFYHKTKTWYFLLSVIILFLQQCMLLSLVYCAYQDRGCSFLGVSSKIMW